MSDEIKNETKITIVKEDLFQTVIWLMVMVLLVGKLFLGYQISWWGVFAPVWIPVALSFTLVALAVLACVVVIACVAVYEFFVNRRNSNDE